MHETFPLEASLDLTNRDAVPPEDELEDELEEELDVGHVTCWCKHCPFRQQSNLTP